MPRASLACEVKMLSMQTPYFPERRILNELLKERATQTGHIQDHATQTGHSQDAKPATILDDEVKAFIVRGLARYESPSRVAEAVKTVFGIEVNRQQVFSYHARGSRPPAERWCELFEVTQAAFLADLSAIGIAQKAVRLRMLERFANDAEARGQTIRAARFMEQAAKECGGIYEGRRSSASRR